MDYGEVARLSFTVDGHWQSRPLIGEGSADPLLNTKLLAAVDHLIVLRHGKPPFRAVLGVPHHAAPGSSSICERRLDSQSLPDPREADENAALYALAAFAALAGRGQPCKLVIMAHSTTHDPNKILDSPYCREIFSETAELIFECHGSKRERRLDLELSAGLNPLPETPAFGRLLAHALEYRYTLGVQRTAGKRRAWVFNRGGEIGEGELELPAHKTLSLVEAGRLHIQALHLEARPRFRRFAQAGGISEDGQALGEGIAHSITRYLSLSSA